MSYGGKDFAISFHTVRKNTIQIAEDIPESSYSFSPAPDVRTVGQMLTHIALSTRIFEELNKDQRLTTLVGFDFLGLRDRLAQLRTAKA
jgi:DinB family protein